MKALKLQSTRMISVLLIMFCIGAWQWEFVLTGLRANIVLNSVIFGTFFFGLTLVFIQMGRLRNEHQALYSLMELNSDALSEKHDDELGLWRMGRCTRVAIVFKPPVILGQAYNLIAEQIYRDGGMSLSTDTIHTLVDNVNNRLVEQRALINFTAGILVLLGLIGTFIGLMITLSSVGDILSSFNFDNGDPSAMVSGLIANLKIPLQGMATGFSSSLFGLVTSLVLSLQVQLITRAGVGLRAEFGSWLGTAAALASGPQNAAKHQSGTAQSGVASGTEGLTKDVVSLLMRTSKHLVEQNEATADRLDALITTVEGLTEHSASQAADTAALTSAVRSLQEQNVVMHQSVCRSVEAYRHLAETTDFTREVAELTTLIASQAEARDNHIVGVEERLMARLEKVSAVREDREAREEARAEARKLSEDLAAERDQMTINELRKLLGKAYDQQRAVFDETVTPAEDAPSEINKGAAR